MIIITQTCPRLHDVASVNFSIRAHVRGALRHLASFLRPEPYNTDYLLTNYSCTLHNDT